MAMLPLVIHKAENFEVGIELVMKVEDDITEVATRILWSYFA